MNELLATDLDGTLIPLEDDAESHEALTVLASALDEAAVALVFVTGRHLASVLDKISEKSLPLPQWMICDVGTSLYRKDGEEFVLEEAYSKTLDELVRGKRAAKLRKCMEDIDGLKLQEPEKQERYKLSFYLDAHKLNDLRDQVKQRLKEDNLPYSIIASVDPFTGDGLIDLLPEGVSKFFAIKWLAEFVGFKLKSVVYAGDSGNDFEPLTGGLRAILVGNADESVRKSVQEAHDAAEWKDRLYLAKGKATAGVLEGCRYFGLID